jgi:O-antigen ligase
VKVSRNIGLIGALVTLLFSPNTNLDPINIIKFSTLFIGAGYLLADYQQVIKAYKSSGKSYRTFVWATLLGVGYQFVGLIMTNAPIWQKIYGAFGRNTGLLTYLALAILALLASTIKESREVLTTIKIFTVVMGIQIVYGLVQWAGLDPYSWKNLYNPIIGTLGNPNFASAFYGIAASLILPLIFTQELNSKFRIFLAVSYPLLFVLTIASDSWQGTGLIIIGASIYILYRIRASKSFKVLAFPLVVIFGGVSALSILGFRGDGLLGGLLNKPTFTIRVDYWQTAINTISNFPLFGVGSDSFGDWFRLMRNEDTVARIGLNVSTNSAHNVVLDMMANTGIFVGLAYLLIVFIILWKSVPQIWNPSQNLNPVFLPIFLAWFAYQVQSLVSINQIGIGVWGWTLQGIMVAMLTKQGDFRNLNQIEAKSKVSKKVKVESEPSLLRIIVTPVFIVIGFIPLYADGNLLSSMKSGDVERVYAAATAFPLEVARINYVTQAFSQNKLPELSLKSAKFGVEKFPNNYDAWDLLRQVTNSQLDRDLAVLNLKRLDPFYEKYTLN